MARPPGESQSMGPENPFVGTWTANLSKSRPHPGNQFQSAKIQFAMAGRTVTITDVVVNASGQEDRCKNTIQVDGNEHTSEHGNGYVLMAGWRGSHVLVTEAKKDGQLVGWGTYEVSADGKTLTISSDEQMIVLDRA